jgi:hypothetical protein
MVTPNTDLQEILEQSKEQKQERKQFDYSKALAEGRLLIPSATIDYPLAATINRYANSNNPIAEFYQNFMFELEKRRHIAKDKKGKDFVCAGYTAEAVADAMVATPMGVGLPGRFTDFYSMLNEKKYLGKEVTDIIMQKYEEARADYAAE